MLVRPPGPGWLEWVAPALDVDGVVVVAVAELRAALELLVAGEADVVLAVTPADLAPLVRFVDATPRTAPLPRGHAGPGLDPRTRTRRVQGPPGRDPQA